MTAVLANVGFTFSTNVKNFYQQKANFCSFSFPSADDDLILCPIAEGLLSLRNSSLWGPMAYSKRREAVKFCRALSKALLMVVGIHHGLALTKQSRSKKQIYLMKCNTL